MKGDWQLLALEDMDRWGIIILFCLFLYLFETFHKKKLNKIWPSLSTLF